MKRTFLLFLLTLFSLPLCLAQYAEAIDSLDFSIGKDNRIYVMLQVNKSKPLRFLFDTGATDMVINTQSPNVRDVVKYDGIVANQGTTGAGTVKRSSRNTVRVGKQKIKNLRFLGIPYEPDIWDGVLGLSFMRRYCIVVDYDRSRLYLFRPGTFQTNENWGTKEVTWHLGVPFIPIDVTINGKDYTVLTEVDTGSDRALDLSTPFVKHHSLLGTLAPFAISRINSSDGGTGELQNVWFDSVRLPHVVINKFPGAFSTLTSGLLANEKVDAMAGNNLLQRFNLVLDFEKDKIYMKPNGRINKKYYDFLP